eukprot:354857-Chlamydomonas_euryale.AAC.39
MAPPRVQCSALPTHQELTEKYEHDHLTQEMCKESLHKYGGADQSASIRRNAFTHNHSRLSAMSFMNVRGLGTAPLNVAPEKSKPGFSIWKRSNMRRCWHQEGEQDAIQMKVTWHAACSTTVRLLVCLKPAVKAAPSPMEHQMYTPQASTPAKADGHGSPSADFVRLMCSVESSSVQKLSSFLQEADRS